LIFVEFQQASNAEVFHLWQLTAYTAPEPEDSTAYTVIDSPLTDGYRSSVFAGFTAGVKSWKLTLPTLASLEVLSNTVTDINGASVSREQYVRSLYAANKTTGTPFVYQDPRDSEYYFVDFADNDLSLARMKVKIYSIGLTLRQRRIAGVYIP